MSADRLPAAPAALTPRSRKLWRAVLAEFELSPAELELLRSALVALDRADEAAAIIAAEGVVTVDRYGSPKAHPATDVESRNRALYGRFLAQLGVKATVESVRRGAKSGPRPRVAPLRPGGH